LLSSLILSSLALLNLIRFIGISLSYFLVFLLSLDLFLLDLSSSLFGSLLDFLLFSLRFVLLGSFLLLLFLLHRFLNRLLLLSGLNLGVFGLLNRFI